MKLDIHTAKLWHKQLIAMLDKEDEVIMKRNAKRIMVQMAHVSANWKRELDEQVAKEKEANK